MEGDSTTARLTMPGGEVKEADRTRRSPLRCKPGTLYVPPGLVCGSSARAGVERVNASETFPPVLWLLPCWTSGWRHGAKLPGVFGPPAEIRDSPDRAGVGGRSGNRTETLCALSI